jgi:beta-glucanase (GH16 family)
MRLPVLPPRRWRWALAGLAAATAAALAVAAPGGAAGVRPSACPAAGVPAPPVGWSLTWSDDFSSCTAGTPADSANWQYDLGTSYPGGAANWGTGEVERMTNSTANVAQDGAGHLAITAVRDGSGNWTSGRLETQRNDFAPPSGGVLRVAARLQQPNVSGAAAAGYWPAFWMLGGPFRGNFTNWPSVGEIDIMEDINGLSSEFGTLHCGPSIPGTCNETTGIGSGQRACNGCQTGFHEYAMEWDRSVSPNQLRWYLDGNNFFTISQNQVDAASWTAATNHGYMVLLNLAMGGGFPAAFGGGPTGSTASGVSMLVDYVALYSRGGGTTPPPTTPPPTTPPPTSPPPTGGTGAYATIQAEAFSAQQGTQTEACSDAGGGQDVGFVANGDWLRYSGVDFGSTPATQFMARVASGAAGGVSGLVEVRLDSPTAPVLGSFAIANTGGWQSWRTVPANISAVTGVHAVYLTFTSGQPADFVNVNYFTFAH